MVIIEKSEITFVCTGHVFNEGEFTTKKSLQSVRQYFPESKIILSTWEDEDLSTVADLYDELVLNKKVPLKYSCCLPKCDWYPKLNSYDSQQLSTYSGLVKTKTKYAVRLRTDFILSNDCFLKNYIELLSVFDGEFNKKKVFKQKVLIHQTGTISPYTTDLPLIHHPSDIFHFGLTEDLLKLWSNTPIPDEVANFFSILETNIANPCLFNHQFTPEQYLWLVTLDKANIKYKRPSYYLSYDKEMVEDQDELFLTNFLILDEIALGVQSKFDRKLLPYTHRFYNFCLYVSNYKRQFKTFNGNKLVNFIRYSEKGKIHKYKISKNKQRLLHSRGVLKSLEAVVNIFFYYCVVVNDELKKMFYKN